MSKVINSIRGGASPRYIPSNPDLHGQSSKPEFREKFAEEIGADGLGGDGPQKRLL
jgi:hypothetical protein